MNPDPEPPSGPDSEQQQIPSTGVPPNLSIPRSCHACRGKKIRCDRKRPCSSCTRSGKACSYPASGPRIRRTKKTIMAEMASRIFSLERSLADANVEHKASRSSPGSPVTRSKDAMFSVQPARESQSRERSREDVLVQKGSSSQYFNEILLSRVIGEEQNIESILTTPPITTGSPYYPPPVSPFNALGILSSPFPSHPPSTFHPPKPVAVRLWNIYVDNVEGCAGLKLLHLPTDEVRVYSTIDDPAKASFENLALCLAIYFASAVSLDDAEAQTILEQDKHANLLIFKVGLEQAFAQGDFLDRPTLTGLHALAIYLSALRVHNHNKGIWILNGLAIRTAESLGLHRNGETLGVSPFQSEIRRRLWWHLLSRDGRAGEDYGLENTTGQCLTSFVNLPLNVDDTDLHPDMKKLPTAKAGWTAMTFSLINIDLVRCMQRLAAIASTSSPPPTESIRAQILNETRTQIEQRLTNCNPVIPSHRLTLHCSHFLLRKLDFVTRQQWLLLHHRTSEEALETSFTTESNLIEALEILAPRLIPEDGLLSQFAWARKAYPQYHVTMYILWHLCVRPEGPNVDRAWEAIETLFCDDEGFTAGFGSKAAVLAALRNKALSVRRQQSRSEDFGGEIGFDISGSDDGWPNWEMLAQGFQPEGVFW